MGAPLKSGIDSRRLRHFVAVCDHGGFSKAASVTGIAQPALTRQIQLLEQELGVQLFTRNGRSAVPTEPGQYLARHARLHLSRLDRLVEQMRRDFTRRPVDVTLGICPTISPLFLDQVRDAARLRPPAVVLSVIEAYSGELSSLMEAGRLDLALSYAPVDDHELRVTKLLSERLVLAAAELPDGDRVTLDQVAGTRLILPSRAHQLRRIIDQAAAARRIDLAPVLELDSLGAVKAMLDVPRGSYATILPYHSVADDARQGRFVIRPIDDAEMVRTVALLRPRDGGWTIPTGLTRRILARADEIRRTLEAVS